METIKEQINEILNDIEKNRQALLQIGLYRPMRDTFQSFAEDLDRDPDWAFDLEQTNQINSRHQQLVEEERDEYLEMDMESGYIEQENRDVYAKLSEIPGPLDPDYPGNKG